MGNVVREIIDVHEIWPDTEISILLILAGQVTKLTDFDNFREYLEKFRPQTGRKN
jgi:hypothetical protein